MALVLLICTNLMGLAFSCKHVYAIDDKGIVPYYALDTCLNYNINSTNVSVMLICDEDQNLKSLEWNNSNCNGDQYTEYNTPMSDEYDYGVECNGDICSYANIRYAYDSDSCKKSGDYYELALVVDVCFDYGDGSIKVICTESEVTFLGYLDFGCSGDIIEEYTAITDNECDYNNRYTQIIECSMTNQNETVNYDIAYDIWKRLAITMGICSIISFICSVIGIWIICKLFKNLYECEYHHIVCCIGFSDYHNWLIEPSSSNKIFALLSTMLYGILFILWTISFGVYFVICIIQKHFIPFKDIYISYISRTVRALADMFYVYYLTTTLLYHIKQESLIKNVVSVRFVKFINCMALLGVLEYIIWIPVSYIASPEPLYHGVDYESLFTVISLIRQIFIVISVLYLYLLGLNNVSHFWAAKNWKENEKFQETEKGHENTKSVTRVTVIICFVVSSIGAVDIMFFIVMYFRKEDPNNMGLMVSLVTGIGLSGIRFIMISLSIYFIYPFGHKRYEKICGRCDIKMYRWCKSRHHKQTQNGGFDGERYIPNKRCCGLLNAKCQKIDESDSEDDGNDVNQHIETIAMTSIAPILHSTIVLLLFECEVL